MIKFKKFLTETIEIPAQAEAFLDDIFAKYPDPTTVLIFLDWLDEKGSELGELFRSLYEGRKTWLSEEKQEILLKEIGYEPGGGNVYSYQTKKGGYIDINYEYFLSFKKDNNWYSTEYPRILKKPTVVSPNTIPFKIKLLTFYLMLINKFYA